MVLKWILIKFLLRILSTAFQISQFRWIGFITESVEYTHMTWFSKHWLIILKMGVNWFSWEIGEAPPANINMILIYVNVFIHITVKLFCLMQSTNMVYDFIICSFKWILSISLIKDLSNTIMLNEKMECYEFWQIFRNFREFFFFNSKIDETLVLIPTFLMYLWSFKDYVQKVS